MENKTTTNTSIGSEAKVTKASRPKAIIQRNTDNKIIAGVCSGIADYYDIDPVIVRLIAGMGFLTFGVGPLIYILLWIILPATNKSVQTVKSTETLNPAV